VGCCACYVRSGVDRKEIRKRRLPLAGAGDPECCSRGRSGVTPPPPAGIVETRIQLSGIGRLLRVGNRREVTPITGPLTGRRPTDPRSSAASSPEISSFECRASHLCLYCWAPSSQKILGITYVILAGRPAAMGTRKRIVHTLGNFPFFPSRQGSRVVGSPCGAPKAPYPPEGARKSRSKRGNGGRPKLSKGGMEGASVAPFSDLMIVILPSGRRPPLLDRARRHCLREHAPSGHRRPSTETALGLVKLC
jgi:hypothetical protein